MKRSAIKTRGKHARSESKTLRENTPYLAERAGGEWLGWHSLEGTHALGVKCEICSRHLPDVIGFRAHIDERRSEADDNIWNIIIACPDCHNHDKYPDGGLRCGTEEAKRIVRERNEAHGIGREQ